MSNFTYDTRNEDPIYLQIKAILQRDPSIGRIQLKQMTGAGDKTCRNRQKWFLRDKEENRTFIKNLKPFPPLSTNPSVKTYLVINDHHIPFQHNAALKIVHMVAKLANVDTIILNGDITDCYEIGRFVHFTAQSLTDEMSQTSIYLQEVRIQHPDTEIIYIAGNHEHRWSSYIHKNIPAMASMEISGLANCLKLADLNIKWVYSGQAESYYNVPGTTLYVGHFDKVHKFSAYTVKNLVEDKHINIIQGHTHRLGAYWKSTKGHKLRGYENGCLRHMSGTEYVMDPNWQWGFSLVYVFPDGSFDVKLLEILEMPKYLFTVYNDMKIEAKIK